MKFHDVVVLSAGDDGNTRMWRPLEVLYPVLEVVMPLLFRRAQNHPITFSKLKPSHHFLVHLKLPQFKKYMLPSFSLLQALTLYVYLNCHLTLTLNVIVLKVSTGVGNTSVHCLPAVDYMYGFSISVVVFL